MNNDIVYGSKPLLKVISVKVEPNYILKVKFNNGECRVYDFKPMLAYPAFISLRDEQAFGNAYIEYGTVVWNNGDIDIAPEELYNKGVLV